MMTTSHRQPLSQHLAQPQVSSTSNRHFTKNAVKSTTDTPAFHGLYIRKDSKANAVFSKVHHDKDNVKPTFSIYCDDETKSEKQNSSRKDNDGEQTKNNDKTESLFFSLETKLAEVFFQSVLCDEVFAILTKVRTEPKSSVSAAKPAIRAEGAGHVASSDAGNHSTKSSKCPRQNQRQPLAPIIVDNNVEISQDKKTDLGALHLFDITEASPSSFSWKDDENSRSRDTFSFNSDTSNSVYSLESSSSRCSSRLSFSASKSAVDYYSSKDTQYENEKARHFSLIYSPPDFLQDIYDYAREQEIKPNLKPPKRYLSKQPHLESSMRSILIDWMVDVVAEYNMELETLHLAVNYVDRFLSKMPIGKDQLQLVGTTSLMIAGKFEEIYPPELDQFALVTDNTYTTTQVMKMERIVLDTLKFDMCVPTIHFFLDHFLSVCRSSQRCTYLSKFLSELVLLDVDFLNFTSSVVAAAIICVANITTESVPWPIDLEHASRYTVADIYDCMSMVLRIFKLAPNLDVRAVVDKYKVDKYCRVSLLKPPCKLPPLTV